MRHLDVDVRLFTSKAERVLFGGVALLALAGLAGVTTEPVATRRTAVIASVRLFDDDGDRPMFAGPLLAPGVPVSRCISVGADGAGTVSMAAKNVTGTLAGDLTVTVDRGAGGSFGDCAAFAGAPVFNGSLSELTAGGGGVPTGWQPQTRGQATFRITVTLNDTADAAGGGTAGADFVWSLAAPDLPPPTATPSPTPTTPPVTPTAPVTTAPVTTAPAVSAAPSQAEGMPSSAPVTSRPAAPVSGPASAAATAGTPSDPAEGSSPSPGRGFFAGTRAAMQKAGAALYKAVSKAAETIVLVADQARKHPTVPAGLVAVLLLFLLFQNRADRRDPKLALAPVWDTRYVWIPKADEDSE